METFKYREILQGLHDELSDDNIKALKFLVQPQIKKRAFASIAHGLNLFEALEDCRLLSPRNMSFLAELLETIRRLDLQARLEEVSVHTDAVYEKAGSICPFRKLLFELREEIPDEDLQRMKFLSLAPRKRESVTDPLDLFTVMIEERRLAPSNLENLSSIFATLARNDLVELISEYQASSNTHDLNGDLLRQNYRSKGENSEATLRQTLNENTGATLRQTLREDTEATLRQTLSENTGATLGQTLRENTGATLRQPLNENCEATLRQTSREDTGATLRQTLSENTGATLRQTLRENTGAIFKQTLSENSEATLRQTLREDTGATLRENISDEYCGNSSSSNSLHGVSVDQVSLQESNDCSSRHAQDCYRMEAKPRGWCYIFDMNSFKCDPHNPHATKLNDRPGSDIDRVKLKDCFGRLHFQVRDFINLSRSDVLSVLQELSSSDHSAFDCLVIAILSHGEQGRFFAADGQTIEDSLLTFFFKASRCPSLAGKPKLFLFSCCRGSSHQLGIPVPQVQTDSPTPADNPSTDVIADEADFLFGYSTVPNHVSYRRTQAGTFFIDAFTKVLLEEAQRTELQHILLKVNNKVSQQAVCNFRQIPQPQHSLRRKLYFL